MIMERINTVAIICLFVAISTAVALQVGVSKVDGMVYAYICRVFENSILSVNGEH